MEWVKLASTYYLDAAVMRAGEAAEVLFVRAMAYCGDQENDGRIPFEALSRLTPTRGRSRANALVREGLWVEVEGGYQFVNWAKRQVDLQRLQAKRAAARKRQANYRDARDGVTNAGSNAVRNTQSQGVSHSREVEVEEEEEEEVEKTIGRAKRSTAMPKDWTPNDKHQEIANNLNLHLNLEATKFADYAAANGKTFKDWDAAFRNWLRNAATYGRPVANGVRPKAPLMDARHLVSAPDGGLSAEEYAKWFADQRAAARAAEDQT